ncbi:hypothetical protein B0F90DRAFT_1258583 [Multifurca ochricompacta]|uniref:DUF6533 domain-containing protein n=1 Tax=Multifurca ochricompacta TaxID=376703 RepID=A0AAD4M9J4_9AGAM|nr:hypothetical protein B0F90DRAFT_1258583 [Multifurca ochricompacta]
MTQWQWSFIDYAGFRTLCLCLLFTPFCHLSFPSKSHSLLSRSSHNSRAHTLTCTLLGTAWLAAPSGSLFRPFMSMGRLLPTLHLIAAALNALRVGRYSIVAAYTVLFYDWIISLDKEVALIYPAPWNAVKGAYLFCRYYPLAIAPFHFWGFLADHDQGVCQSHYHALYACIMPAMLSAQFILMLRSYAFTGRKKIILAILSASFFGLSGYVVWVLGKQLNQRSGCFATSNQPTHDSVLEVGAYHLGIISVLTALFDCMNVFIVVQHCIQERSTLGPLGQSFLKQGVLVYVIMTILNTLTIGTYFTSHLLHQGLGSWFAYILPSALVMLSASLPRVFADLTDHDLALQSCRLVLMLRRKASPTETELCIQYSHMVDEALEMIAVEPVPDDT